MKSWLVLLLSVACSGGGHGSAPDARVDSAPIPVDGSAAQACPAAVVPAACNATNGLGHPIPVCSTAAPCTLVTGATETREITAPTCNDGEDPLQTWTDVNGDTRYACVFTPPDAGTAPRPLVVFFHGSHGDADDVYNFTALRTKAPTYPLGTTENGFVLAAVQGRNLHWYGPNPPASHHDYFYRDLGTQTCNPDIRSADALIDRLVASGTVDAQRIYVAGWSNGTYFSQMYAIARFATPTPGGNHVAAAIGYAGADPFGDLIDNTGPSCQLATYPPSSVPLYSIHRSCDALVPCDASQANGLTGIDVEAWQGLLASRVHDGAAVDVIIDENAAQVGSCATSCSEVQGTLNHLRWPDGLRQDGATDWEPAMLDFLRAHPHP